MAGRPKQMLKRVSAMDTRIGALITDLWSLCPEVYQRGHVKRPDPEDRVATAWDEVLSVASALQVGMEELVDALREKVSVVEAERWKNGGGMVADAEGDGDELDATEDDRAAGELSGVKTCASAATLDDVV